MSAFINLDAIAEVLTLDLVENPYDAQARDRALGRYVYALSTDDQVQVLSQTLGTVLAFLEEVQKATPAARLHMSLTLMASRAALTNKKDERKTHDQ